jgi:hypothetical protein
MTRVVNAKEDTLLKIPPSHPADKGREPYLGRVGEPSTQNDTLSQVSVPEL